MTTDAGREHRRLQRLFLRAILSIALGAFIWMLWSTPALWLAAQPYRTHLTLRDGAVLAPLLARAWFLLGAWQLSGCVLGSHHNPFYRGRYLRACVLAPLAPFLLPLRTAAPSPQP